jgi:hypothetical protein
MDVEAKELQRHGGDDIWFCEIINFSHERDGERSLVHISETERERSEGFKWVLFFPIHICYLAGSKT